MTRVISGLENFINNNSKKNIKYGLVSNPSAILFDGRAAWKVLLDNKIELSALFGPEHGFLSIAQDAVDCDDTIFNGIPVYSLYGKRQKPEKENLQNVDALIFDIQDVGCRYYTYIYTLAFVMESCVEFGIPLIVLDRPNPIGGVKVEGSPILKEDSSFVGNYGLCPRHGMTIGEIALYYKGEFFNDLQLDVVKMSNWKREFLWDDCNLPWHSPSPNLSTPNCALVYPGTCLFEGTWLSEGRGTARPFEIVGSSWIDGEKLRTALASLNLPGVVFSSLSFCPSSSKFKGENCEGVLLNVVDSDKFHALNTGIAMIYTINHLWPNKFSWRENWENGKAPFFDLLAGGSELRKIISFGTLPQALTYANKATETFLKIRSKYLIY